MNKLTTSLTTGTRDTGTGTSSHEHTSKLVETHYYRNPGLGMEGKDFHKVVK